MDLVLNFLRNKLKLNKDDKVVIGVSAGPDSMFLLHILLNLRKELDFSIIVAHINHNVRKESEEEEEFLKNYCKENNVVFESKKIEKYEPINFHMYAREFRYKFYEELIDKYQANHLMTAHHGDDLVETILMRLTRGSTLNGYSGISLISENKGYKIVRPLLYMTKEEIKEYNDNNNIPYRVDKSNYSSKYTRNRYRMEVLPFLKEENKEVHLKFLKFSKILENANNYIEKVVDNIYNNVVENDKINIIKLKEEDVFLQRLLLERVIKESSIDLSKVNDKHIDAILDLVNKNRTGTEIDLPDEYVACVCYNYLEIKKKEDYQEYCLEFKEGMVLPNGMKFERLENEENGNDTLHLESSTIKLPIYVRTRKEGDTIELKGTGRKKVKDIFIDCKVPRKLRATYPVVVDSNNNIIWIPKLKKSKYDSKNHEKCDIIIKCL